MTCPGTQWSWNAVILISSPVMINLVDEMSLLVFLVAGATVMQTVIKTFKIMMFSRKGRQAGIHYSWGFFSVPRVFYQRRFPSKNNVCCTRCRNCSFGFTGLYSMHCSFQEDLYLSVLRPICIYGHNYTVRSIAFVCISAATSLAFSAILFEAIFAWWPNDPLPSIVLSESKKGNACFPTRRSLAILLVFCFMNILCDKT